MKRRLDFVTNSSSTSYTCVICGDTVADWDLSLSEAEMYQCNYGHVFCENHLDETISQVDIVVSYLEGLLRDPPHWARKSEQRVQYRDLLDELQGCTDKQKQAEIAVDIYDDFDIRCTFPTECCPICSMKQVSETDLHNYLLRYYDRDEEEIAKEMKGNFLTYADLRKYIYNGR